MKHRSNWFAYCEIRGMNGNKLNIKKTADHLFIKEWVCDAVWSEYVILCEGVGM